ncbi:hypothetical protein CfE428DRAFT_0408 [Chthoniobacter flavus Ellin428]|uniref:Uncharacterized protein n=1 Tax=Chthoniobacter flavus Ellin428 TaxID=497964 RepID=B4CUP5_9BACT|nr:hypothetical protein [Chthoniobacter flavus]EDY22283.1 hypothetical protein CfE428DRAFT_0408 [Chthoniobacter flavus Ellin428]TCO94700.1 hypothetical protein EV701_102169 [Chthoniobacter flavus]
MKLPKNLGTTLLGLYLVLIGVVGLFGISLGTLSFVLPLLALVTGVCLLLGK